MERDIALRLFQNNYCILPGIGKLAVVAAPANTDIVNSRINAPLQTIVFSAAQKNDTFSNELSEASNHLQSLLSERKTATLEGIGTFTKNNNGTISFTAEKIDTVFTPSVIAKKVIHPDAEHEVLVGDKQTTNVLMTGYLSGEENKKERYRWWIAAIIISIIALIVVVIRFSSSPSLGNATLIDPAISDTTYHLIK